MCLGSLPTSFHIHQRRGGVISVRLCAHSNVRISSSSRLAACARRSSSLREFCRLVFISKVKRVPTLVANVTCGRLG
jgi:hypothetical protein